jgi:prepilin peptidase CpaA
VISILVRYVVLLLLILVAVGGDLRDYRIYNLPVMIGIAAGFTINTVSDGLRGLAASVLAMLVPFILLAALFALRMLGAGDIKLFCAIGAIMGLEFILYTMVFSFLEGGIIALGIMVVKGNFKERFRYIGTYLKTCFLTRKLQAYTDFNDRSDGAKFPFSVAIAAGTLTGILFSYFF